MTRMPHGQCTLPPDASGRILDKLAGLEQVIGPEHVRQALEDTGCFDCRRCRLTREVIFWVVLAMGILADLPIRQVFKYARRLRPVPVCGTAHTPAGQRGVRHLSVA